MERDSTKRSMPYPLLLCPGSCFIGYQQSIRSSWTVRVTILGVDAERSTCCGRMDAINTPCSSSNLVCTFFEGQIIDNKHFTFAQQQHHNNDIINNNKTEQKHWKQLTPFMKHIYPIIINTDKTSANHNKTNSLPEDNFTATETKNTSKRKRRRQRAEINDESLTSQQTITSNNNDSSITDNTLLLSTLSSSLSNLNEVLYNCRYIFMRWKEQYFLCGDGGMLSIAGYYYVCMDRVNGDINGFYSDVSRVNRACQEIVLHRIPDTKTDGRVSIG